MKSPFDILANLGGCIFHRLTGLYCPGCGGTRAVHAFFDGDILRSLHFNPLVVYAAVVFVYIIIGWVYRIVRNRTGAENRPYHFPDWTLWGAVIVLGVNFAIKNGALLVFGIDLLK